MCYWYVFWSVVTRAYVGIPTCSGKSNFYLEFSCRTISCLLTSNEAMFVGLSCLSLITGCVPKIFTLLCLLVNFLATETNELKFGVKLLSRLRFLCFKNQQNYESKRFRKWRLFEIVRLLKVLSHCSLFDLCQHITYKVMYQVQMRLRKTTKKFHRRS